MTRDNARKIFTDLFVKEKDEHEMFFSFCLMGLSASEYSLGIIVYLLLHALAYFLVVILRGL